MREHLVEAYLVTKIQKIKDAICWKWQSSRRGVPDRIVLLPIPEEHQAIVAKYVHFIEVKAPGAKPTAQQDHVHKLMAAKGFYVRVVDSPADVDAYLGTLA